MTEIMPFPENNCKTVLLDRPEGVLFYQLNASRSKVMTV